MTSVKHLDSHGCFYSFLILKYCEHAALSSALPEPPDPGLERPPSTAGELAAPQLICHRMRIEKPPAPHPKGIRVLLL